MSLLEVRDIHTYYGDSHVLQGVTINAEKGKVVAILGRNGAGKTTLLRSIIGFTPPRQGSILFKGQDITQLNIYSIVRLGIGLVPQGRRTFPSLTVKENLEIAERSGAGSRWSVDFNVYGVARARLFPGQNIKRRRAADAGLRPRPGRQSRSAPYG